jgi:nicotinamidase-related amidase
MLNTVDESVVVLVDLQRRLMPAIHQGDQVVAQSVRLARIAGLLGMPVLGTEQSPGSLGENVEDIKRLCVETFAKESFDACADGLVKALPAQRTKIVVAGCEAHVCVMQTVLGLIDRGYQVALVRDAVGSRRPVDRDTALERLRHAGATLVTTEMIAFEWLGRADHVHFREVLKLVK